MKILLFGTPSFSAGVLTFLITKGIDICAVVTRPDRPKGRSKTPIPPPVKDVAQEHNIPVHQPEKASESEFTETLQSYEPDLFVVVAYGEILKQRVLDIPKVACINVHTSLLPKYRGAAPVQHAIINGEKETGVTIMHMARKMDAGPIIKTARVSIGANTTCGELEQQLCDIGSKLLLEVIHDFEKGTVEEIPQNDDEATFAPKIELEDCEIHWNKPAEEIHNLVRGVNPYPGAWCTSTVRGQKKRLKIISSTIEKKLSGKPGEILIYGKEGIVVACAHNALRLLEVKLEGKKTISVEDFVHGHPDVNMTFFI